MKIFSNTNTSRYYYRTRWRISAICVTFNNYIFWNLCTASYINFIARIWLICSNTDISAWINNYVFSSWCIKFYIITVRGFNICIACNIFNSTQWTPCSVSITFKFFIITIISDITIVIIIQNWFFSTILSNKNVITNWNFNGAWIFKINYSILINIYTFNTISWHLQFIWICCIVMSCCYYLTSSSWIFNTSKWTPTIASISFKFIIIGIVTYISRDTFWLLTMNWITWGSNHLSNWSVITNRHP